MLSLPEGFSGNVPSEYLAQLEQMLYKTPAAGFEARCLVLLVIYAVAIVLVLVNMVVTQLIARRKGAPKVWLYRIVNGYISLNFILVTEFCGLITPLVLFCYTYFQYDTFHNQRGIRSTRPWRYFYLIPLVMSGFLISISSLQAFLVVATQRGRAWMPRPFYANTLFGTLLVVYTTTLFLVGGLATRQWYREETAFQATRDLLARAASSWSGALSSESASAIDASYAAFIASTERLLPYQRAVIFLATGYATINMFLNIGAVSLVLMIRSQIKSVELAGASPTEDPTGAGVLSVFASPLHSNERARQIRELKRVAMDQLNLSAFIVVLCILWIPQTIFMGGWGVRDGMSWIKLEFSWFIIAWSFGPYQLLVVAYFLYNQIQTYRLLRYSNGGSNSISSGIHRISLSGAVSGIMVERQTDEKVEIGDEEMYDQRGRPNRVRVDLGMRMEESPRLKEEARLRELQGDV